MATLATWDAHAHFQTLAALRASSPWVPLVVVAEPPVRAQHELPFSLLVPDASRISVSPPGDGALLDAINLALLRRPEPGDGDIAAYAALRLAPEVRDPVLEALGGEHRRSLCRRLERAGAGPPSAWQRRAMVLRALSLVWRRNWSEEAAALEQGVAVSTLSRACRRCFGQGWPQLLGIGTWEGVLEQGMRWHAGVTANERLGRFGQKVAGSGKAGSGMA